MYKKRLAINAIAVLIYTIQKILEEKKLGIILFINIKRVFNYILKM